MKKRRNVHYGDWHNYVKQSSQQSSGNEWSDPSPDELEEKMKAIRSNKLGRK